VIRKPTPETVAVKVLVSHGGIGPLVKGKTCALAGTDAATATAATHRPKVLALQRVIIEGKGDIIR